MHPKLADDIAEHTHTHTQLHLLTKGTDTQ